MIYGIYGKLIQKDPVVFLTPGGLALKVNIPDRLLENFEVGTNYHVNTRVVVREDSWTLFGSIEEGDLELFDLLLSKVSGVGPVGAFAVISAAPSGEVWKWIKAGNPDVFKKCPGVGAKTAQLIILGLAGKLPKKETTASSASIPENYRDAKKALIALGKSAKQADEMLQAVFPGNEGLSSGALVTKSFSKK